MRAAMQPIKRSILCASMLLALSVAPLNAQIRMELGGSERTSDLTPAQRAFTDAYLAAATGSDINRYKPLLHPRTRACMSAANADYFETTFKHRVNKVAMSPKTSVETLPDTVPFLKMFERNGYHFPARPTHAIHIDIATTGPTLFTISAFSALENGTWYEILPCPTAKALEVMRKSQARSDSVSARAKKLVQELRDPLRGEILALLKKDQSIRAAKRYAAVANVDLNTARLVVDALEKLGR
jgi:hypothetical protein